MGFCTEGSFGSRSGKTDATDTTKHLRNGGGGDDYLGYDGVGRGADFPAVTRFRA
jgi:hypothetical protein